jgi:hypothetical protein
VRMRTLVAGAVALPTFGCGGADAPVDAPPGNVAVGGLQARLVTASQRTLLARRHVGVRLRASHTRTVRIGIQAIEDIPGRAPGPLKRLTTTRRVTVPAEREVTVSLPLTRRGARALATCAPHRLRLAVERAAVEAGSERLEPSRCARYFSPHSFWNAPLPADAPVDPQSGAIVAALQAQVDDAVGRHYGPTINTASYSTPVYEVAENQPRVAVTLDDRATYRRTLRAALRAVPLPPDVQPAAGTDAHLVLWQPSTNTMWEFWKLHRQADGWHAKVSTSHGVFPALWGATATSLPLLGGLIRPEELARGRIDHVLALAIPRPRAGVWAAPARRTDGWVREPDAVPEGARLRLDPRLDVDALDLPPLVRVLARAAQRYGIVVRDTAGTVALYAEAPTAQRPISYARFFGAQPLWQLLSRFPWQHLQVLRMDLNTYAGAPGT